MCGASSLLMSVLVPVLVLGASSLLLEFSDIDAFSSLLAAMPAVSKFSDAFSLLLAAMPAVQDSSLLLAAMPVVHDSSLLLAAMPVVLDSSLLLAKMPAVLDSSSLLLATMPTVLDLPVVLDSSLLLATMLVVLDPSLLLAKMLAVLVPVHAFSCSMNLISVLRMARCFSVSHSFQIFFCRFCVPN